MNARSPDPQSMHNQSKYCQSIKPLHFARMTNDALLDAPSMPISRSLQRPRNHKYARTLIKTRLEKRWQGTQGKAKLKKV